MLFAAFVAAVLFVIVQSFAMPWAMQKRLEEFKRKWPTISDDEFVAECSPDTNPKTALKVRRIISEQLGIPYQHIYPSQSFCDDLDY